MNGTNKTAAARTVIVVPTYNERDCVEKLTSAIHRHAPDTDILFVDDNSPDGTGSLADSLAAKDPRVKVLHRKKKEGIGRAYVAGFTWALAHGYAYVMQMDADLSHDPAAIPVFMEKVKGYDAVFGSRYSRGVSVRNWSFKRLLLSKASNVFISRMLRINTTDTTTAFKCFRREVLEEVGLGRMKGKQNAFLIELVYWTIKSGFRTLEIPFMFVEREEGESKMRPSVAFESLLTVFRLMLHNIFPSPAQKRPTDACNR